MRPGQNRSIPSKSRRAIKRRLSWRHEPSTEMERAVKSLKQKNSPGAFPPAEEARKILEEIQKAQPPQDQEDQKKQEQDKKKEEQQKQDQNKKNEDQQKQEQKDQQKKEQQKKEQEKDESEKKDATKERARRTEETGRSQEVRRAEAKAATAADLARPDRRCAAEGTGTAAGKARARPQNEGPRARQGSRGEGLVMRRAHHAMIGLVVAALLSFCRRMRVRPTIRKSRSKPVPREIYHRRKHRLRRRDSQREESRWRPDLVGLARGFRRRLPTATSRIINRPPSFSTAGSPSRPASVMRTVSA